MEKYHLKLTADEAALVSEMDIELDHPHHADGRAAYLKNQKPILMLMRSLEARNGLPEERLSYWQDPSYHRGRIKASRRGPFERNGCGSDDIYAHPHFIKYLRYFLFGSELPDAVIQEFEEAVGEPRWVNGSDSIKLGKFARQLARRHGLDRSQAPEEFVKLCLDIGLRRNNAEIIMASVKQVR
jgi:hypothetical protein